jgi:hypothetical protein
VQGGINRFHYCRQVVENGIVAKPQHAILASFYELLTDRIFRLLVLVNRTVQLNYEACLGTTEVCNVIADRVLTAELVSKAARANHTPHTSFSWRGFVPHSPSSLAYLGPTIARNSWSVFTLLHWHQPFYG